MSSTTENTFENGTRVRVHAPDDHAHGHTGVVTGYDPGGTSDGLPVEIAWQMPYLLELDEPMLLVTGGVLGPLALLGVMEVTKIRVSGTALRPV